MSCSAREELKATSLCWIVHWACPLLFRWWGKRKEIKQPPEKEVHCIFVHIRYNILIILFNLITAHTPTSSKSSNSVVFRLVSVLFVYLRSVVLWARSSSMFRPWRDNFFWPSMSSAVPVFGTVCVFFYWLIWSEVPGQLMASPVVHLLSVSPCICLYIR